MGKSIKGVFESECSDFVADASFAKRLRLYVVGFTNKNQDHIAFFGGNLLGVQVVRFTDHDRDTFFNEIVEVDDGPLEDRLLDLPTVNENFSVSSDTMNLTCAWLLNKIYESKVLTKEAQHQAMIDIALVLQFKFLTSRLYRHFRYPAEKSVAEATYAELSNKYDIKRYGNWLALFIARAEALISSDSIHYRAITKMDDDGDVIYLLNDTQGRIRDMLKNIYDVFLRVHHQGSRIVSEAAVIDHDGEQILKDKTRSLPQYERYINSIVTDKNSFIREELTKIIEKLVHTLPPRLFRHSLEWMSDNYRQRGATEVEEVLGATLVHAFEYFSDNRTFVKNTKNLPELLGRLKGVYMSSRSTDPSLLELREKVEKIVKTATGNKNPSTIAAVRTGVLLYVVLRSITMHHYASIAA